MKKIYSTHKHKLRQKRSTRRRFSEAIKTKRKRRKRKHLAQGKTKKERNLERIKAKYTNVNAPVYFSFINHAEASIEFISKLDAFCKKRKPVFIILKKVKFLDYSAITALLSIMFTFKSNNISFNGDFPSNFNLRKSLIDSEFFKYLEKETIKNWHC